MAQTTDRRAARPSTGRAQLAQRAVNAAQCLRAFPRYSVRPVAAVFQVSVRSVKRGQLLLEDGNPELLADVLLGRVSLTEAATTIHDARTIAFLMRKQPPAVVERSDVEVSA